ncbi:hybrid sensor histidine kinase/response regulator [Zavarzinia sp. CC-PAN008]|uniref:ATP-binding response regulator n=1 Tax=Zavarzinia sp. CC-PAN008 TaxID=3243332 RepID=UPI003F74A29C
MTPLVPALAGLAAWLLGVLGVVALRGVAAAWPAAARTAALGLAGAVLVTLAMTLPLPVAASLNAAALATLSVLTLEEGAAVGAIALLGGLALGIASAPGAGAQAAALGMGFGACLAGVLAARFLARTGRRAGWRELVVLGLLDGVLLAAAQLALPAVEGAATLPIASGLAPLVLALLAAAATALAMGRLLALAEAARGPLPQDEAARAAALLDTATRLANGVPAFVAFAEVTPSGTTDPAAILWTQRFAPDLPLRAADGQAADALGPFIQRLAASAAGSDTWTAMPPVWLRREGHEQMLQFSALPVGQPSPGHPLIAILQHDLTLEFGAIDAADRRSAFLAGFSSVFAESVRQVKEGTLSIAGIARAINRLAVQALGADSAQVWQPDTLTGLSNCLDHYDGTSQALQRLPSVRIADYADIFDAVARDRIVIRHNDGSDPRFDIEDQRRAAGGIAQDRRSVMFIGAEAMQSMGAVLEVQAGHTRPDWTDEEKTVAIVIANLMGFLLLLDRHRQILEALDHVADGLVAVSAEGGVFYANRAALRYGHAPDIVERAARGDAMPAHAFPLLAGGEATVEVDWPDDAGSRALLVTRSRLKDGAGVMVVRDVTEFRRARDAHAALESRRQQATTMEALGRLAGGLAHDFNNLLGAVMGFGRFLEEDLDPASKQHYYAQRILSACQRGKEFVAQILSFAKGGSEAREVLPVREVLDETRANILSMAPANVEIVIEPGPDDLYVTMNRAQATQVIMNLITNAIAAVQRGGGTVRIRLDRVHGAEIEQDAGSARIGVVDPALTYVRIDVADNGVGIAEADLPRVFEPFFTRRAEGRSGTGLGLAVVSSIVLSVQGVCTIRSRLGQGSVFTVHLPLAMPVAALRQASVPHDLHGGSERILVIDDDVDVTDAITIGLERLGYAAVGVNDPECALEALAEDPAAFDVVITDQMMPKLNGCEVARRVRQLDGGHGVILCTGLDSGGVEREARAAGVDAFLAKPASIAALAEAIRAWALSRRSGAPQSSGTSVPTSVTACGSSAEE